MPEQPSYCSDQEVGRGKSLSIFSNKQNLKTAIATGPVPPVQVAERSAHSLLRPHRSFPGLCVCSGLTHYSHKGATLVRRDVLKAVPPLCHVGWGSSI